MQTVARTKHRKLPNIIIKYKNKNKIFQMDSDNGSIRRQILSAICGKNVLFFNRFDSLTFFDTIFRQFIDFIIWISMQLVVCQFFGISKTRYVTTEWPIVSQGIDICAVHLFCWCNRWQFHNFVRDKKIRQPKDNVHNWIFSNRQLSFQSKTKIEIYSFGHTIRHECIQIFF